MSNRPSHIPAEAIELAGNWIWIEDGTVFGFVIGDDCPEDVYEMTAPEEQSFLDAINAAFGTNYQLADFDGR